MLKSVIVCVIILACICIHVSESSVTKGVVPLNSDTFDKVRNAVCRELKFCLYLKTSNNSPWRLFVHLTKTPRRLMETRRLLEIRRLFLQ